MAILELDEAKGTTNIQNSNRDSHNIHMYLVHNIYVHITADANSVEAMAEVTLHSSFKSAWWVSPDSPVAR